MDDSFSILGINPKHLLKEAELKSPILVKHYVFEDLLDSGENLLFRKLTLENGFEFYLYSLLKKTKTPFGREEENILGYYIGFKDGNVLNFEDFNFKISSFDEFSLLVEAVETGEGETFCFELCNVGELPERIKGELPVSLAVYSESVEKIETPVHLNQVADENKELFKLAIKGNEKAYEKLERELGNLAQEILKMSSSPETLFDTFVLNSENNYTLIGITTSLREVSLGDKKLTVISILAEDRRFVILSRNAGQIKEGDRVKVKGKMYGVALT